ncbi:hydrogen gas-evolving membrane-bound hydrogenase subunit E [Modestobacter sp. SYSU DS0511]
MSLLVALGLLLALSALAPLLARRLGRATGYVLAVGFLLVGGVLLTHTRAVLAGSVVEWSAEWLPSLGVSLTLRLDGVSLVFSLIALGVGALVLAYCPHYIDEEDAHGPLYPLLTFFAAAMVGLVLADDMVVLYLCWELTTLCSFALVSTAGTPATRAARQALLVTVAGGLALLAAVVLVSVTAGTTRLSAVLADPAVVLDSPVALPVGVLLAVAAFTKSAQLPVHFWLPGAMVAMTPVSAYLHAATMVKAGIYLLIRFSPLYADEPAWQATLIVVGLTTAVVGAVMALREHDLKAVLAQSTVSQLGLLVAAIGVGTAEALAAALLHTVAHALFKATLFMLVGIIDEETGRRDVRELSGLRRVMPWTAAFTGLAALSLAGVPPLLGFVSKEYLFAAFLDTELAPWAGPVAASAAVLASAFTVAYSARIVYGAFGGGATEPPDLHEPAPAFLAPAAVAAVAGLLLGPAVALLDPLVDAATGAALPGGEPPEVYLWHGFTPELGMSAVTLTAGLLMFWRRDAVDRVLQRMRLPDGSELFERAHAGLLAAGAAVGRPDRVPVLAAHLARPVLGLLVLAGVGVAALGELPPRAGSSEPVEWPLLVLLALALAGAVATGSALVLIGLVGLVGLLVSVWFVLAGAVDVAITLLLVEVLSGVVVVLVLRGTPVGLPRSGPARRGPAAPLAVGVGLAGAGATAALTGRRDLSPAGEFYLTRGEELTSGENVVNTVLVDFRGLDTLLESLVVGVAALGLLVLRARAGTARPPASGVRDSIAGTGTPTEDVVLRVSTRLLVPGMLALSAFLLWRGHDAPGGGFIAALVAGVAVTLQRLVLGPYQRLGRALRARPLVGAGVLVLLGVALLPLLWGAPPLQPFEVPGLYALGIGSSLVFDAGVYLLVIGLVTATVDTLADRASGDDGGRTPATGAEATVAGGAR